MSGPTGAASLQRIFNHPVIQSYSACSRHIFSQLHRCHTAAMGMHYYTCDAETVSISTVSIIVAVTGIALTAAE